MIPSDSSRFLAFMDATIPTNTPFIAKAERQSECRTIKSKMFAESETSLLYYQTTTQAPGAPCAFCVLQKHHFCTNRRRLERQELQEHSVYYRSITFVLPVHDSSAGSSRSILCTTEASLLYYQTTTRAPGAPGAFCVLQKHHFCTTRRRLERLELQEHSV